MAEDRPSDGVEKENVNSDSGQNDNLQCDQCSFRFSQKSNLKRHKREKHGLGKTDGETAHDEDLGCHHCKKVFASERSRARHILLMHKSSDVESDMVESKKSVSSSRITCRDCDASFKTIALLRQHLTEDHDVENASQKEEMFFKSIQGEMRCCIKCLLLVIHYIKLYLVYVPTYSFNPTIPFILVYQYLDTNIDTYHQVFHLQPTAKCQLQVDAVHC